MVETFIKALAVLLVVALGLPPANGQVNSYLGLWGHVFDGGSSKNSSSTQTATNTTTNTESSLAVLTERLHKATEEWKEDAEEVRTRLVQRLNSLKLGKGSDGPTAAVAGDNNNALVKLLSTLPSSSELEQPTKNQLAAAEAFGVLERLHDKLKSEGTNGAHQAELAALALALASLRRHSSSALDRSADHNTFIEDVSRPFSHFGIVLPDAMASHFDGSWCIRMQNFGNAVGYRSLYLGSAPCGAQSNYSSTGMVTWGHKTAFTVDCSMRSPNVVEPSSEGESTGGDSAGSVVSGMIRSAAVKAVSQLNAMMQRNMVCQLAVASASDNASVGTGALLKYAMPAPFILGNHLNAMKLRVCNIHPSSVQYPAALRRTNATITVDDLKLNGRELAVPRLEARQGMNGAGKECEIVLLRLPGRELADSFVLSGVVDLDVGSGLWGVGEQASVDVQIGALKLFNT